MVYEKESKVAALVVPDFDSLKNWLQQNGWDYENDTKAISRVEVQSLLIDEINSFYNQKMLEPEKLKFIAWHDQPWTIENGELTPTMKVKREVVFEKCKEKIKRARDIAEFQDLKTITH
jgi:long-chain acyl-CoA synthetase